LELVLNTLRTTAFTPLMTVEARMSQMTYLPTWVLSQSTPLENLSKACMVSPIKRPFVLPGRPRVGGFR
jgi:hypothetical protein